MKFVFEGFELDTDKTYVDYAGDIVKLALLADGSLAYSVYSDGCYGDYTNHYGKSGNGFSHSFTEIEVKGNVKKFELYEKCKIYLFSDDGDDWYPDIFDYKDQYGRYVGVVNGPWNNIKLVEKSDIGVVL